MSTPAKYDPTLIIRHIRVLNQRGHAWSRESANVVAAEFGISGDVAFTWGQKVYAKYASEWNGLNGSLVQKMEIFLSDRFEFRINQISGDLTWRETNGQWAPCVYEDVWRTVQHNLHWFKVKKITMGDIMSLLKSSYVPKYNPFKEYFESLPAWDGTDHIRDLGNHIICEEQDFWLKMFEKTLVRMIACSYALHENRIINVFIQEEQEKGKDTFIRFLCPQELHEYYKEDPLVPDKDAEIALTKNFIWNLTELDQLNKREISEIKGIISRKVVKQRAAYARQDESRNRVVNLWGSTNKTEFLTDDQHTRWLCFVVKDISWAYSNTIDIQKVWAQAWHLYKENYDYSLNAQEKEIRNTRNKDFEVMPDEKQLILSYLTKTAVGEGEFMLPTEIQIYLAAVTANRIRLNTLNITRSLTQLGFAKENRIIGAHKARGFWLRKKPLEQSNGFQGNGHQTSSKPEPIDNIELPF